MLIVIIFSFFTIGPTTHESDRFPNRIQHPPTAAERRSKYHGPRIVADDFNLDFPND
ncbi:hypothetical protein BIFANG_03758 [Bifidobacterium angulatum DSM 20098 = JCM 7096]|uniref:Uncharacterized protein n=1 Tax=Bifidobacterium angulatum DSM 20098 = JCM 7096 TaxID=518635 RepID=C4FHC1_9BIFI|nr:hypothetical protein BIFANG_03758 [Bifidobacterium angulatum DSM 20098 = JCM 7096]